MRDRTTPLIEEARLADALHAPVGAPRVAMAQILLTGITGFLGGEIAVALLRLPDVHLHCLVRGAAERSAHQRFASTCQRLGIAAERVTLVEGDLCALSSASPALAERIDTVVHCAATVNLFAPYSALRAPNVLGARAVLEFAARGPAKAIHALSTAGVFLSPHYRSRRAFEEEAVAGEDGLSNGYARSKWVADTMMKRARERGFDVTLYRPSFVGWHSASGRHGEHDLIALLLASSWQAGCAPLLDLQINATPVDHVAATALALMSDPAARGGTYHLVQETAVSFIDLSGTAGLPLVDFPTWVAAVAERAPRFATFARMVHGAQGDEGSGSVELRREHDRTYDDARVRERLGPSFRPPPPLDADALARFQRRLRGR